MSTYETKNPNAVYFTKFYSIGSSVRVTKNIEHTNYFYH